MNKDQIYFMWLYGFCNFQIICKNVYGHIKRMQISAECSTSRQAYEVHWQHHRGAWGHLAPKNFDPKMISNAKFDNFSIKMANVCILYTHFL